MILIDSYFLSIEHIEHITVEPLSDPLYTVDVHMTGSKIVFGSSKDEVMDIEMAFELRNRFVRAILNYKSNDKPEIQHVRFPTYQEVHPEAEAEKS